MAYRNGSRVVFCCTPTGIKCAEPGGTEPVYIDPGGTYPQQYFSITLPSKAVIDNCERLRTRFMRHRVRVQGMVDTLAGKPVIALHDINDIILVAA